MTGHVLYPHQRDAAMAAVRSVDGLMRIVEQIQVRPPAKHQYKTLPPLPKKTEGEAQAAEAEQAAAETSAAETPAVAGAQATAENESSTTEFDVGPAKGPRAEQESASAPASPTANGAAKVDAAEEDSSETDFELGPATLSSDERKLAKTVQIAHEAHLDADAVAAAGSELGETDFDLGPAPVRRRAAAPESPTA